MFDKEQLNKLYRYALSLAVKEDVAYDLVQAALEKYLKRQGETVAKPLAYIKIIIRNLFIDYERHKKVITIVSSEEVEASSIEEIDQFSMEDILISQEEVEVLIKGLNMEENELLYLWAVEDYTVDEIAKIYEKPKGTILSKLHRLKKRIRLDYIKEA